MTQENKLNIFVNKINDDSEKERETRLFMSCKESDYIRVSLSY